MLLIVAALVQACGSDDGRTGPSRSGPTEVVITIGGLQLAQISQDCSGTLTVTAPDMEPLTTPIPQDGRLSLVLSGGLKTFTVTLVCKKLSGPQSFTGRAQAEVIPGQRVTLTIPVTVNAPPAAAASCSPSTADIGAASTCQCGAVDPDPSDQLTFSWSAPTGSLSTTVGSQTLFSATTPGTFGVTCTVSDGKVTSVGTAAVTFRFNLTGSYQGTIHKTAGPGAGETDPLTASVQQTGDSGAGPFSILGPGGTDGTLAFTVSGSAFSGQATTPSDVCELSGQIALAGGSLSVSGTFACSPSGTQGTFTATRS